MNEFKLCKDERLIHKIWRNFKGNDEGKTPSIILTNKQIRCQFLNPNYQIMMWDDEKSDSFMKKEFPKYYSLWKGYRFEIQRVDTLKYFLLYHFGGLYMDMDVECLKSFDEYFNPKKIYLVEETSFISPYKFNNFLISSPKRHPFWLFVFRELEESRHNIEELDTMHVLDSSGPGVIQRAYEKYILLNGTEDFSILPKELFNPCDVCGNTSSSIDMAYLVHESNISWSESARVLAFIMCNKMVIIIAIMFVAVLLVYNSE